MTWVSRIFLLRPCIDDCAWRALLDHAWDEGLDAVDDAPKVDLDQPLPAIVVLPGPTSATNPCIVHENGDLMERRVGLLLELLDVLAPAHISGDRSNTLCISAGFLDDLRFGALQVLAGEIRYADVHSEPRKRLCSSEPDAARATGNNRRTAPSQSRMRAHSVLP